MANNLAAIEAGHANVRFTAGTEEFKKDTGKNEQQYTKSQERMYREYLKWQERMAKLYVRTREREAAARRREEKDIRDGYERLVKFQQIAGEREAAGRQKQRNIEARERARDSRIRRQEDERQKNWRMQFDASELERQRKHARAMRRIEKEESLGYANLKQRQNESEERRQERDARIRRVRLRQEETDLERKERLREREVRRQREFNARMDALERHRSETKAARDKRDEDRARARDEREAKRAAKQAERDYKSNLAYVAATGTILGGKAMEAGRWGIGLINDSIQQYGSVESYLNTIRGSVRDKTNDLIGDMQRLQDQAFKLGELSEYDASHIAAAMDRLSVEKAAPAQIQAVMRSVVDVASIYSDPLRGKVLPDQSANALMEIANAIGGDITKIPDIADKLAVVSRSTKLDLVELRDAMRYAGGGHSEAGGSFDELLAMQVVLSKLGYRGEMGGTAIRGITDSMLNPTDNALADYERMGITMPQKGNLSLLSVLDQFEAKLGHLSPVERAQVIARAFPNRQMTGVQVLTGRTAEIRAEMAKMQASQGKGAEIAATKREGVLFGADVYESTKQTLKAQLGESLKSEYLAFMSVLTSGMSMLSGVLKDYPMVGKAFATVVTGLAALGVVLAGIATTMGAAAGLKLLLSASSSLATTGGALGASMMLLGRLPVILSTTASVLNRFVAIPALIVMALSELDSYLETGLFAKLQEMLGMGEVQQIGPKAGSGAVMGLGGVANIGQGLVGPLGQLIPQQWKDAAGVVQNGLADQQWQQRKAGLQRLGNKALRTGGNLLDRVKTGIHVWGGKAEEFKSQMVQQAAENWESSPQNPKNRKALEAFADEYSDPLEAGNRADPDTWRSFLLSHRKTERANAQAKGAQLQERALTNLGDFSLRHGGGMDLMYKFMDAKRPDKKEEEAQKAAVASEAHLKEIATKLTQGHVLGGKGR